MSYDLAVPESGAKGPQSAGPASSCSRAANGELYFRKNRKQRSDAQGRLRGHRVRGGPQELRVYTEQERIITLLNLKDLLERLPSAQFLRVHKSYLVSLAKIKAVDGGLKLFQDGKASTPLGYAYRRSFFEVLQRYVVSGKGNLAAE